MLKGAISLMLNISTAISILSLRVKKFNKFFLLRINEITTEMEKNFEMDIIQKLRKNSNEPVVVPVTSPPEPTAEDSKSSTTIHGTFEPSGGIINEFIAIEKQNKKGVITKCVSKVKYKVINH